ncbi:MazG-like family protein [Cryptosporangium arvum]|uniref:MazG-like family protein n=1 Tax=Cryptosporangium arvum TaxID=80871 RepID=UPI0004B83EDE|nr:MazG-like family protein [Cryptosporangium arvum]
MDDVTAAARAAVAWLDAHNGRSPDEVSARVGKVAEELGEVWAAWIGATGQNPRKGHTHTPADVADELADVALAAATASLSLPGSGRPAAGSDLVDGGADGFVGVLLRLTAAVGRTASARLDDEDTAARLADVIGAARAAIAPLGLDPDTVLAGRAATVRARFSGPAPR